MPSTNETCATCGSPFVEGLATNLDPTHRELVELLRFMTGIEPEPTVVPNLTQQTQEVGGSTANLDDQLLMQPVSIYKPASEVELVFLKHIREMEGVVVAQAVIDQLLIEGSVVEEATARAEGKSNGTSGALPRRLRRGPQHSDMDRDVLDFNGNDQVPCSAGRTLNGQV
jgi:hypothetical protein